MNQLWQDLRYGARMLIKQPGFTLIAALTLALGIGANTAIFSVINALILNPPRIAEADRVASIWRTRQTNAPKATSHISTCRIGARRAGVSRRSRVTNPTDSFCSMMSRPNACQGMRVTANFLSLLKVKPLRGRDFRVEEEKRGAEGVVMISHQFWQNRLGGSEAALAARLDSEWKAVHRHRRSAARLRVPAGSEQTEAHNHHRGGRRKSG